MAVTLLDYAGREVNVSPEAAESLLASGNWTRAEAPAKTTKAASAAKARAAKAKTTTTK